jgi:tetrahydromethanopterin S-methyltransferase subunit C
VPLKRETFAGRRTSTRVVYGASGVRTTAGPGLGPIPFS